VTEANRWAVIPAAGMGKRMQAALPKQYLKLLGRPVIDHTIERLLFHPAIDGVYVALSHDDPYWPDTEFARHPDLVRVTGGVERCYSVLNALHALADRADANDWVLVHDAARPCVRREDIGRLIQQAEAHNVGGLLGMPVRDTMKRTDTDKLVTETVERNQLWHAFTPQMFRFGVLYQAMQDAIQAGYLVTDEASAIEWAGFEPIMVEGQPDNIKITQPQDLALAEFYLSQQ
jgi:2-C-methyl-D-erythritol 4-phosphate cytidylyltransferase